MLAETKNATKRKGSHSSFSLLLIDEISRREKLEHDPSRVPVGNESDSDRDDEEEENKLKNSVESISTKLCVLQQKISRK